MSYRPISVLLKAIVTGVFPLGEHLFPGNFKFGKIREGELVILTHEHRVHGAHLLAITAIDAKSQIDHIAVHDLLMIFAFRGFECYGIGRADSRTQAAPNTVFGSNLCYWLATVLAYAERIKMTSLEAFLDDGTTMFSEQLFPGGWGSVEVSVDGAARSPLLSCT